MRETARRRGLGWPSIFLLAAAFAAIEEAFTTQTLFNSDYLKLNLHLLAPAYIPALGIGGWWTIYVLTRSRAGRGVMPGGALHQLALAGGAATAYAWHAFPQPPVVGQPGTVDLIGNTVFAACLILLLILAARRNTPISSVSAPPPR